MSFLKSAKDFEQVEKFIFSFMTFHSLLDLLLCNFKQRNGGNLLILTQIIIIIIIEIFNIINIIL